MFSEEKLSQTRQRNSKVLVQNLFTQTHLPVLNIKNCISKLYIKIIIKRETRTGKAYAYQNTFEF